MSVSSRREAQGETDKECLQSGPLWRENRIGGSSEQEPVRFRSLQRIQTQGQVKQF